MLGKIFHSTLPENVTRNLGEFYLGQARTEKEPGRFDIVLVLRSRKRSPDVTWERERGFEKSASP